MELRAERICKAYGGVPVLQNVTFTAGPGVTCLMGPSGRGKTDAAADPDGAGAGGQRAGRSACRLPLGGGL